MAKEQQKQQPNDFREMVAGTVGRDLLQALVQEIRLLPDVWPKLTKDKQDDVIDRLRSRVEDNIRMAVYTIASNGRTVVAGSLDQITIKDGVKAVIKFGSHSENLEGLYEAASESKSVLVVVADAGEFIVGINKVVGENDQREMDLGHEYHDNDGGGMADTDTGNIGLPAPEKDEPKNDEPTAEELQEYWQEGYQAAADGRPQSFCPIVRPELVVAWIKGWKDWHESKDQDVA